MFRFLCFLPVIVVANALSGVSFTIVSQINPVILQCRASFDASKDKIITFEWTEAPNIKLATNVYKTEKSSFSTTVHNMTVVNNTSIILHNSSELISRIVILPVSNESIVCQTHDNSNLTCEVYSSNVTDNIIVSSNTVSLTTDETHYSTISTLTSTQQSTINETHYSTTPLPLTQHSNRHTLSTKRSNYFPSTTAISIEQSTSSSTDISHLTTNEPHLSSTKPTHNVSSSNETQPALTTMFETYATEENFSGDQSSIDSNIASTEAIVTSSHIKLSHNDITTADMSTVGSDIKRSNVIGNYMQFSDPNSIHDMIKGVMIGSGISVATVVVILLVIQFIYQCDKIRKIRVYNIKHVQV
ncbi:ORF_072R [Scale drop disease virus]|uniref:ORF_072R n=1 Tax=Scale drop disease virus TaxID=1697349 RepID=A0A0K1L690_9VIRU|nr:ORF_072R [Scale drop disease virus]AKU37487.1 ORF_072R [Scale drop disease virus]